MTFAMAAPVPFPKRLALRPGQRVAVLGAPERWCARFEAHLRVQVDPDAKVIRNLRPVWAPPADCLLLFIDGLADLEDRIGPACERLHPDGQLWIVWRSRRSADVTEDVVRRIGLTAGMVVTRARRLDTVWSGMRMVITRDNRDAVAYRLRGGAGSAQQAARARRRA
jgi:hypothetical protein